MVDDDTIVRALVTATLEGAGFAVRSCSDVHAARVLVEDFDPDLVVLEANLKGGPSGAQFGVMLAKLHPGIALLYLTRYPNVLYSDRSLIEHVRSHAVLVKDDITDASALVQGVEDALVGHKPSTAPVTRVDASVQRLNETQLDILGLVAQGFTNALIAEQRGTKERTIERQLKSAYETLGLVTSREQNARVVAAMKVAQALGWRQLDAPASNAEAGLWSVHETEPHADRVAILVDEWRISCGPAMRGALEELVDAVGDGAIAGSDLAALLQGFAQPDAVVSRAVELLVISAYLPPLRHEVESLLGGHLNEWFAPGRDRSRRTSAAIRAFVVGLALGYVTESWRNAGAPVDLRNEAELFAEAFAQPSIPVRLPAVRAAHLDDPPEWMPAGDDHWDVVFQATLDCVGELGFEASSINVVAAAVGVDSGAILGDHATMHDLFLQASDRMLAPAVELNHRYQSELEAFHSTAIADACMIRENMQPGHRRLRTITLEQLRLAAHDPLMQQAFDKAVRGQEEQMEMNAPTALAPGVLHASVVTEIAMTTGLGVVAQLRQDAWRLPFDVVLVPWRGLQEQQAAAARPT